MTDELPRHVVVGVDTHKDFHVAHASDGLGRPLGTLKVSANRSGYRGLLEWAHGLGVIDRVGVEGPGSYGAGLARYLAQAGVVVLEVGRPNRQDRARHGKSDPADAAAAAAAVLAGKALGAPKSGDGPVETMRVLHVARASAVRAKTAAVVAMRDVVVTAPDEIRDQLISHSIHNIVLFRVLREIHQRQDSEGLEPSLGFSSRPADEEVA